MPFHVHPAVYPVWEEGWGGGCGQYGSMGVVSMGVVSMGEGGCVGGCVGGGQYGRRGVVSMGGGYNL